MNSTILDSSKSSDTGSCLAFFIILIPFEVADSANPQKERARTPSLHLLRRPTTARNEMQNKKNAP
jgi:hypothetical protein